jgi:ribosomal protein S18 acetylase RimI-like enzyme
MTDPSTPTLLHLAGDALTAFFRAAPGYEVRARREAWLVTTGETGAFGNCVAVVEPGGTAVATLREFVGRLRELGMPGLVFLPPTAGAGFDAVCTEFGLAPAAPTPCMVLLAADLPAPRGPGAFHIDRIADADALRRAVAILAAAFSMPEDAVGRCLGEGLLAEPAVTLYAARQDAQMVSTVAVSRSGRLAYVAIMATAPDCHRRGAGSAVLAHALAEHVAAGVTHVALVASDEGKALYERFGFRTAFELATWEIPGSATPAS